MSRFTRVLSIYACSLLTAIAVLLVVTLVKLDDQSSQASVQAWRVSRLSKQLADIVQVTGANTLKGQTLGGGIPVYVIGCDVPGGVPVYVRNWYEIGR